ncbi:MAG: hypothetical protein MRZ17_02890 [Acholeplasmataceae bacterium]|nr:hypothetical protein [Acholeplasmataceae bacterium]
MVKRKFFLVILFSIVIIGTIFLTIGLVYLLISDYNEKHYVPKDKMHLTYDNFEEYGQKYIDYYIKVIEEEGLLYDYTIEKKYFDDKNEKSVFGRYDVCITFDENTYLEIMLTPSRLRLYFKMKNQTLDQISNFDERYFDIVDKICHFSIYNYPIKKDELVTAMNTDTSTEYSYRQYGKQWHYDSLFPNDIYMNVKPSNNLYNVYIDVNGYLTDENVWP